MHRSVWRVAATAAKLIMEKRDIFLFPMYTLCKNGIYSTVDNVPLSERFQAVSNRHAGTEGGSP